MCEERDNEIECLLENFASGTEVESCSSPESSFADFRSTSSSLTSPTVSEFTTDSMSCSDNETDDGGVKSAKVDTYKMVDDNLDKNVQPRDMRIDNQVRSYHFFHTYAVKDRIDLSDMSDKIEVPEVYDLKNLLPSSDDKKQLLSNYGFLFTRTLRKHMPYFKKLCIGTKWHITHKYSSEMAQKSNCEWPN